MPLRYLTQFFFFTRYGCPTSVIVTVNMFHLSSCRWWLLPCWFAHGTCSSCELFKSCFTLLIGLMVIGSLRLDVALTWTLSLPRRRRWCWMVIKKTVVFNHCYAFTTQEDSDTDFELFQGLSGKQQNQTLLLHLGRTALESCTIHSTACNFFLFSLLLG